MIPEQRHHLLEILRTQRAALTSEGDVDVLGDTQSEVVEKPDDDAAPLTEMNQVIASNRNRERALRLHQIDAALARMQEDPEDFGLCEECDEPIAMRRLEVMPWSRLCTTCQSLREQDDTPKGRRHLRDYR